MTSTNLAIATSGEGASALQRIAAVHDEALRNELVTQSYCELSQHLRTALRRDDANWATFATWTSRAAGNFIRGDRIPKLVHAILQSTQGNESSKLATAPTLPKRRASLFSARVLECVTHVVREANWQVYREIAPVLEAFAVWVAGSRRPDDAALARFTGRLDSSPSRLGGQDLLAHALRNYYAARFEREPARASEKILHGNILIAWHEQLRLRASVLLLLDVPVADILRVSDAAADARLSTTWRFLVTRTMLTSHVPEGRRLPPSPRTQRRAAECGLPKDALELEYEPLELTGSREASEDLMDLRERMKRAARWYWENQHTRALFEAPFVGLDHARLAALVRAAPGSPAAAPARKKPQIRPAPPASGAWSAQRGWGSWPSKHGAVDPLLEAALAISAPRVAR